MATTKRENADDAGELDDVATSFARAHDALRAREGMLAAEAFFALVARLDDERALDALSPGFAASLARMRAAGSDALGRALGVFLDAPMRRSLGLFATPEHVADALVALGGPRAGERIHDPCCGTGSLLLAACRSVPNLRLSGADVNANLVALAARLLPAGTELAVADARRPQPATFDLVLANPPFGTARARGGARNRSDEELRFVVGFADMVRPGGRVAVVLPKGALENDAGVSAFREVDSRIRLRAVLELPADAFADAGTRATTVLASFERCGADAPVLVATVPVDDAASGGDVVRRAAEALAGRLRGPEAGVMREPPRAHDVVHVLAVDPARPLETYAQARRALALSGHAARRTSGAPSPRATRTLGSLVALAQTGKTPPRDAYGDRGVFIVKVGNLTGRGLDDTPRERNFVDGSIVPTSLALARFDLLLTSTAHAARYLALKVDLVPDELEGATFVGELMRLRAAHGVDPFELLCLLRWPRVRSSLQALARGQSAHLRPRDLLALEIPDVDIPSELRASVDEELALRARARALASVQSEAFARLDSSVAHLSQSAEGAYAPGRAQRGGKLA